MGKARLASAVSLLGILCFILLCAKDSLKGEVIHTQKTVFFSGFVKKESMYTKIENITTMQKVGEQIQFKEEGVELGEAAFIIHSYAELNANYAFYEGKLIMDGEIYEKTQEGIYRKSGILFEGVSIKLPYKQLGKHLFVNWASLYYIDMGEEQKSWKYHQDRVISEKTENGSIQAFYIYDGKVLYYLLPEKWGNTRETAESGFYQIQWPLGETEEILTDSYLGDNWELGPNFGPREDGTIYIQDEETGNHYYLRKGEDGKWKEEFIAYDYGLSMERFVKFNKQGAIYYGDDEVTVVRDDGEIEVLPMVPGRYLNKRLFLDSNYFELNDEAEAWYLTEDGMIRPKPNKERHPDSLIQYDYEGNVVARYWFDPSLWEEGYFYRKLIYLEGRLVVFLEKEETGELLMGEIKF